jgi:hypothetical protein
MPIAPRKLTLVASFALLATGALADELPLHELVPGATSGAANSGIRCALSGDVMVLGEPGHAPGSALNDGRATIFRFDGNAWIEEAQLEGPLDGHEERFGMGVALSPDARWLAVGANRYGLGGAVFLYEHGSQGWQLAQTVVPGDLADDDRFGEAVAMTDELLVIGAPYADSEFAFERGAAYVFRRDGSDTWQEEAKVLASDGGPADLYGSAVDIDGETFIVGAWNDTFFSGFRWGSAYIVRHEGGGVWSQIERFKPNALTTQNGEFGRAVAIDGARVLVGAPKDDPDDTANRGSAFVFVEGVDSWPLEQELAIVGGGSGDALGAAVALDGDVLVVGASGAGVGGEAYAFRYDGSTWIQSDVLSDPAAELGDGLGYGGLELEGDLVLAATPFSDQGGGTFNQGSALVFDLLDAPWAWLGRGLAGADGTPVFSPAGELTAGSTYEWSIEHAAPSTAVTLVIGLGELGAALKGGVLVPTPDILVAGLSTDANGELLIGGSWPAGLPSGASVFFQGWIADATGPVGFSATHGVSATLP